jgi:peroxiredoxin
MSQPEKKSSRIASRDGTAIAGAILMTIVAALSAPIAAWSAQSLIDDHAPDFALKNITGKNLRLSEYRGEVVLLSFWSTTCGRCRDQLSVVNDLFVAHREQGLQVLSISIDHEARDARKTAADLDLNIPVLLDDEHVVSRLYDLGTLPLTVLIDHHGTVRQIYAGFQRGDGQRYRTELEKLLVE